MLRSKQLVKPAVIGVSVLVLGYAIFNQGGLSPQGKTDNAGSATLSWSTPTENEDESPLVDLVGYVIHYTTPEGKIAESIYVDDPRATSYTIDNLSPGTYHFSVSAVQADGRESTMSNEMSKTIP